MLSSTSFASWDGNSDRRRAFAIKQHVTGGSSDSGQLGIAGPEAGEVLVGFLELEALVPVHVCQGSSRSPAHACMFCVGSLLPCSVQCCFCEQHPVKLQRGIVQ